MMTNPSHSNAATESHVELTTVCKPTNYTVSIWVWALHFWYTLLDIHVVHHCVQFSMIFLYSYKYSRITLASQMGLHDQLFYDSAQNLFSNLFHS